jgi:lipopolysaccharide transport system ATP-binding protein
MNSITVSQLGKTFARTGQRHAEFTALDDISLTAAPGDVLGIVGRNGAGKSTLLKILARILRPTRGRIELNGRVGSLLEVGTGFHPELTGRENIFLNAAILGMTRREIFRSFDAIVDFAGTVDFLDEPVKHYSSGMTMRLAFAVAAHVEPEILLMDEVLAVGDADFQRKCFERIEKVSRSGQTVLFVSHNIHAVLRLCNRAILLEHGRVAAEGTATEIAAHYLALTGGNVSERSWTEGEAAPGDATARLRRLRICSPSGEGLSALDIGQPFGIEMEFDLLASETVFPSLIINNEWGPICWTTDAASHAHGTPRPAGRHQAVAWFPANFLTAGRMTVSASLLSFSNVEHFRELEAISFQALETLGGSRGHFTAHIDGGIRPLLRWEEKHTAL